MKNPIDEFLKDSPKYLSYLAELCLDFAVVIKERFEEHPVISSQKLLSEKLNKSEAEISKYLTGQHNFTFGTVAKISGAFDERLIVALTEKNIKKIVNKYLNENGLKTTKKSSYHISTMAQQVAHLPEEPIVSVNAAWGSSFSSGETPVNYIERIQELT